MSVEDKTPEAIIEFWIGAAADDPDIAAGRNGFWYGTDAGHDAVIRENFGGVLQSIEFGRLLEWGETATGALALIVVLDQFTRNIHRGKKEAFAHDQLARAIAVRCVDRGMDRELSIPGRAFAYHPFEHSEEIADQERSIQLFEQLVTEAPEAWKGFARGFVGYAYRHHEIIAEFGRFPHRNAVLGRESTAEEKAFLERSSSFGQ